MPIKKKKFIDKKKSVTFRLVHRSQKDPLAADETAPQHVLLECDNHTNTEEKQERREEQRKYGIYYDDDYNYLQHLRDVTEIYEWEPVIEKNNIPSDQAIALEDTASDDQAGSQHQKRVTLNLPSSVFQSNVEESEGLLNKAAPRTGPRPDWDPDIVAALDDDFDFENSENELEDDFIALANPADMETKMVSYANDGSYGDDDEDDSELSFGSEETKSRFTNYSMSSSILPRSENLQGLDDHFEKFFEKYDDEEIGALDCDEIQGFIKPDSEIMQQLMKEFNESQEKGALRDLIKDDQMDIVDESESSSEEYEDVVVQEKPTEKWDCESIISTYSTTNNRPRLISEPSKVKRIEILSKSGLPRDTLNVKGLTDKLLQKLDNENTNASKGSISSKISTVSAVRCRNETPEERKERKAVIKEIRRERRVEKKANKLAFKEEEKRQEKVMINLKQNLSAIKLL